MILDIGVGEDPHGDVNIDYYRTRYCNLIANFECALPFRDRVFDKVYACEVLEHVENVHQALREITRVAKQDAEIIIQLPKPKYMFQPKFSLMLFYANLPFSLFHLSYFYRYLKQVRTRKPRWYHSSFVDDRVISKFLVVKQKSDFNSNFMLWLILPTRIGHFIRRKTPHKLYSGDRYICRVK